MQRGLDRRADALLLSTYSQVTLSGGSKKEDTQLLRLRLP
jgi:hypothetical protein